ncbi:unnamed protein product, partial [Rhizoctonia solani]
SRAPRQPLAQPLAPPQLSEPPPSNVSTSARDSVPPNSNDAKSWVEQFSASSENSLSLSAGDIATTSAEQSLSLPTHSVPPTTGTDIDTQSETGAGATTEFHSLPTDNGDADVERSPEDAGGPRDELESIIEADININPNSIPEQGSISGGTDTKSDSLMSVPETSSQASGSSADKDSAVMVNLDYPPSTENFPTPPPLSNKEKLALWKELTILTFTRALTSLYALALLALLTNTQLSLLARYRYLAAIREARRAESKQRRAASGGLFFGSPVSEDDDVLSIHPDSEMGDEMDLNEEGGYWDEEGRWWDASGRGGLFGRDGVGSLTERKFLTLGWWFLNRGWKHIGERVREAVSEVFNGLSLKSQISPKELEELILRVRVIIEGDPATFLLNFDEGAKVKLAALLPGVARWTHLALNGVPNEIIEGFGELREVAGYSAVVLSSFEGVPGSYA